MKKLLIVACALFIYSCAQEPLRQPSQTSDPADTFRQDPETRALTNPNFSESILMGSISAPGTLPVGATERYIWYSTPQRSEIEAKRRGTMDLVTSIGIRKEGHSDYIVTKSVLGLAGSIIQLDPYTFTEPGRYIVKGNVSYYYTENGTLKAGEFYQEKMMAVGVLHPGTIVGNQNYSVLAAPRTLTGGVAIPAPGVTAPITYQWQKSYDNNDWSWSDISGATGATYNPPTAYQTIHYRRAAKQGTDTAYSNVVKLTPIIPTPVLEANKTSARVGEVVRFIATNWTITAATIEWRTNGTMYTNHLFGTHPEYEASPAQYTSSLTVECRISWMGLTSEWGRADVTVAY